MKFDITFFATDSFNIDLIKNEDDFIEHYIFTDEDGFLSIESGGFLNASKEVELLLGFLFDADKSPIELYADLQTKIIDLSDFKKQVISEQNLETNYPSWLEESNRENTMDEFGMLVCYIGYIQHNINKKHLLCIVRNY